MEITTIKLFNSSIFVINMTQRAKMYLNPENYNKYKILKDYSSSALYNYLKIKTLQRYRTFLLLQPSGMTSLLNSKVREWVCDIYLIKE